MAEGLARAWTRLREHNPDLPGCIQTLLVLAVYENVDEGVTGSSLERTLLSEICALTAEGLQAGFRVHYFAGKCIADVFMLALVFSMGSACYYWLYLNQDYITSRPFWGSARQAMESNNNTLQLRLTQDRWDIYPWQIEHCDGFSLIRRGSESRPSSSPLFAFKPSLIRLELLRRAHANLQLPAVSLTTRHSADFERRLSTQIEALGYRVGVLLPVPLALTEATYTNQADRDPESEERPKPKSET